MAVKYDKLYKVMADRNMKESTLTSYAGVSRNIMTRIRRNKYISLESIEKICNALACKVDDIVDFTTDDE
jgi:DNA-binding Xre family transcriptional regulator